MKKGEIHYTQNASPHIIVIIVVLGVWKIYFNPVKKCLKPSSHLHSLSHTLSLSISFYALPNMLMWIMVLNSILRRQMARQMDNIGLGKAQRIRVCSLNIK